MCGLKDAYFSKTFTSSFKDSRVEVSVNNFQQHCFLLAANRGAEDSILSFVYETNTTTYVLAKFEVACLYCKHSTFKIIIQTYRAYLYRVLQTQSLHRHLVEMLKLKAILFCSCNDVFPYKTVGYILYHCSQGLDR